MMMMMMIMMRGALIWRVSGFVGFGGSSLFKCSRTSSRQTVDSRQQTAHSRQQTLDTRQQTIDSRQHI
jgi:hypothetical protein